MQADPITLSEKYFQSATVCPANEAQYNFDVGKTLMNQQDIPLNVLARIPDLNGSAHTAGQASPNPCKLLSSSGRLLGQTISCKLLGALTLFLLVGAAIPISIKSKKAADESTAAPAAAVQKPAANICLQQASVIAEPAKTLVAPAAKPVPVRPVVVVPAVPEKAAATVKIPASPGTGPDATASVNNSSASTGSVPAPMMSQWTPETTGATSGGNGGTALGNVSSSVRQAEYQADVQNTGAMSTPWRK
jgi:hypothetical protein